MAPNPVFTVFFLCLLQALTHQQHIQCTLLTLSPSIPGLSDTQTVQTDLYPCQKTAT